MNKDSKKLFNFNAAPSLLRISILKNVDIQDRLVLLTSTRAIRQEILSQGGFPQKVRCLSYDFWHFRVRDDKLLTKILFIRVFTGRIMCFGQHQRHSRSFEPRFDDFCLMTSSWWRLFQRITPRRIKFDMQPRQVDEEDDYEVLKFLPQTSEIDELSAPHGFLPGTAMNAIFGNFPMRFTSSHLRYLPEISEDFKDSFVKHYGECQKITIYGDNTEALWETLAKTRIESLTSPLSNPEQVRRMLIKTLQDGLPLAGPEAELIFYVRCLRDFDNVEAHISRLSKILENSEHLVKIRNLPNVELKIIAENSRKLLAEHCYRKNIGGIDYIWILARNEEMVYVFARKLGL